MQGHENLPTLPQLSQQRQRNIKARITLNSILSPEMISELNRQLTGLDVEAEAEILDDWFMRLNNGRN
jgi:hypothetical protein